MMLVTSDFALFTGSRAQVICNLEILHANSAGIRKYSVKVNKHNTKYYVLTFFEPPSDTLSPHLQPKHLFNTGCSICQHSLRIQLDFSASRILQYLFYCPISFTTGKNISCAKLTSPNLPRLPSLPLHHADRHNDRLLFEHRVYQQPNGLKFRVPLVFGVGDDG
jgi:hypothetical protein